MSEIFDCATKAEEIGRDLSGLRGVLVMMGGVQEVDDEEMRAALNVVVRTLDTVIVGLGDLERRLYQLE